MEKRAMSPWLALRRLATRTTVAGAVIVLAGAQAEYGAQEDYNVEPRYGSGHLSATGIGSLPSPGSDVAVELGSYDALYPENPIHEAARRAAIRAVRDRGWTVTDMAPLALEVRVDASPSPAAPAQGPRRPRRIAGGSEVPPEIDRSGRLDIPQDPTPIPEADRVPDVYPQVRVPLGRRPSTTNADYRVTLTLFRRGEEPIWTASIEAAGDIPDPRRLVGELTRSALDSLGTSVERDFAISCAQADVARGGICLD